MWSSRWLKSLSCTTPTVAAGCREISNHHLSHDGGAWIVWMWGKTIFAMMLTSSTCPSLDVDDEKPFQFLNIFWAKVLRLLFCTLSRLQDLFLDLRCLRFESKCDNVFVRLNGACSTECSCVTKRRHKVDSYHMFANAYFGNCSTFEKTCRISMASEEISYPTPFGWCVVMLSLWWARSEAFARMGFSLGFLLYCFVH